MQAWPGLAFMVLLFLLETLAWASLDLPPMESES